MKPVRKMEMSICPLRDEAVFLKITEETHKRCPLISGEMEIAHAWQEVA